MKIKFRKILRHLSSKTFLGALAFSFSLWLYINLNTEFVAYVNLPLDINLPENRSIEEDLPEQVSVEVRGTGWQIFNLMYLNTAAKCEIDLTKKSIKDSVYEIGRTDMIKNLTNLGNVQTMDVVPQSLNLKTGRKGEYTVIVVPEVEVTPAEGYIIVGGVKVKPDLITIKGNDKKIRGITKWETEKFKFEEMDENVEAVIPLSNKFGNAVELSDKEVTLSANIQKRAEITVKDIRLQINGASLPGIHHIRPLVFDVIIEGGIAEIEDLNYDDIIVSINTTDVINDAAGLIRPDVILPKNIKLLSIDPPLLWHTIKRPKSFAALK